MAIHVDKKRLRRETIENPKWIRRYKRGTIAAAVIAMVLGWGWIARSFTDYWNPVKQAQTINQVCKHGKLEMVLEGFKWTPDIESRFDAETNRTYYDSPDGEFYKDHNTEKFYYIPKEHKD